MRLLSSILLIFTLSSGFALEGFDAYGRYCPLNADYLGAEIKPEIGGQYIIRCLNKHGVAYHTEILDTAEAFAIGGWHQVNDDIAQLCFGLEPEDCRF